jgi:hypothetical protein
VKRFLFWVFVGYVIGSLDAPDDFHDVWDEE